ncbi:MAG: pantetheine-phosphate adenylyltransferase [Planctomycetota bacterium JB042]
MTDAIYPGTFDPVTLGHVDVVERGSRLFDRLLVAVARNLEKRPLFTPDERVEMFRAALGDRFPNVEVTTFDGLVVERARAGGYGVLLRGLRNVDDFVGESQMALMNRELAPEIETVYLSPSARYTHVASRLVREAVALGGDLSALLPAGVPERLRARLSERRSEATRGGT